MRDKRTRDYEGVGGRLLAVAERNLAELVTGIDGGLYSPEGLLPFDHLTCPIVRRFGAVKSRIPKLIAEYLLASCVTTPLGADLRGPHGLRGRSALSQMTREQNKHAPHKHTHRYIDQIDSRHKTLSTPTKALYIAAAAT